MRGVLGIDVSAYQDRSGKVIDWSSVAASGVGFAIIRHSDGHRQDGAFTRNVAGASGAGLVIGAYHLLRASEALGHFETATEDWLVGSLGATSMPLAVDFEKVGPKDAFCDGVSADENKETLLACVRWYRERAGEYPIIYTGPSFWGEFLKAGKLDDEELSTLAECPLWLADYRAHQPFTIQPPAPWKHVSLWQCTASGVIPGIPSCYDATGAKLDLNVALADLADLTSKVCR